MEKRGLAIAIIAGIVIVAVVAGVATQMESDDAREVWRKVVACEADSGLDDAPLYAGGAVGLRGAWDAFSAFALFVLATAVVGAFGKWGLGVVAAFALPVAYFGEPYSFFGVWLPILGGTMFGAIACVATFGRRALVGKRVARILRRWRMACCG